MRRKIIGSVFPGLCYVVLSLCIGECHPFSRETMYDSFPEESYTFYISDHHGSMLPLRQYSAFNTDEFTHYYNTICEHRKISGDSVFRSDVLSVDMGREMAQEVERRLYGTTSIGTFQVHGVRFDLQGDSIRTIDKVMYESKPSK